MYILLPIAILPSIILGGYVYLKDKNEKEPTNLLIKLFIGGILSSLVAVFLTYLLYYIFKINIFNVNYHDISSVFIHAFIVVGLVEEVSKWIFTRIITRKTKEYNYSFDIIVYSVFVSLGFATLENILYAFYTSRIDVVLIRAITTVPAHMFFSIFMGYFLLKAKSCLINGYMIRKYIYLFFSIIVPTVLHGFFDFCIMLKSTNLIMIFIIFIGILYIMSFIFL